MAKLVIEADQFPKGEIVVQVFLCEGPNGTVELRAKRSNSPSHVDGDTTALLLTIFPDGSIRRWPHNTIGEGDKVFKYDVYNRVIID